LSGYLHHFTSKKRVCKNLTRPTGLPNLLTASYNGSMKLSWEPFTFDLTRIFRIVHRGRPSCPSVRFRRPGWAAAGSQRPVYGRQLSGCEVDPSIRAGLRGRTQGSATSGISCLSLLHSLIFFSTPHAHVRLVAFRMDFAFSQCLEYGAARFVGMGAVAEHTARHTLT